MKFRERAKKAWNVFTQAEKDRDSEVDPPQHFMGATSYRRPDKQYYRQYGGRDLRKSIFTRFAVDFANVEIRHVRVDANGRFKENIVSNLNDCLNVEANLDQGAFAFRQDICQTLLEQGTIAIVPVDVADEPTSTGSLDIETMRVGTIVDWRPYSVRVRLYREDKGDFEELTLPKSMVAVIENPFYQIMNEPSSILSRLARKIALMDAIDEQIGAGKLDMIIQLPYIVKTETKRNQAETRRAQLEDQLRNSDYGIGYIDGTERITQLNRPVENNLMKNVEVLEQKALEQLGITPEILNQTASEEVMLNYMTRIIKPILEVVVEGMRRKFLSKTARTQHQSIEYFLDPFALLPVSKIGELADKLIRNEIATPNELRVNIGFKPHPDPKADRLNNPNMPSEEPPYETEPPEEEGSNQNGS